MYSGYFNYRSKTAESGLDRSIFVWNWWRINARDPHWVPPYYPGFRRELETRHNSHLARLDPIYVYLEALPRGTITGGRSPYPGSAPPALTGGYFEQAVAAAVILKDPRRRDGAGYLSLLHCTNDPESLERLISKAAELAFETGSNSLIGPVGLSPYLESGLLQDHWDQVPPLYTAYNPPYLPEIARPLSEPLHSSRLFELALSPERTAAVQSGAQIDPLDPRRLGEDLLPLFAGSLSEGAADPPPDAEEASFLLRWISYWPIQAWLASIDAQPAGFIILGPDLAPLLKRARGGRNFFWRAWLRRAAGRPVRRGRILFGGVQPGSRGQGIGLQLFQHASNFARDQGWENITAGPVRQDSAAAGLLEHIGARPCQSYQIVRWET